MSRSTSFSAMFLLILIASIVKSDDSQGIHENADERSVKEVAPDGTVPRIKEFTPDFIEQGKHNLNTACSRCHGRNGRGGKGPDLTDGVYRHVQTDREILDVIANGISGTGMPGLGAAYEDFYLPILAYIRSEGAKPKEKASTPSGNIARGKELFEKHNCANCHWVGSGGGRLGTNLSKLAATAEYVRESMRYPNSQVDGTHQSVSLVDKDGRILVGKRLSENSFDILVMDGNENLHSVAKRDVDSLDYHSESWMPNYRDVLTTKDIEDLTTFVFSLRKATTK